MPTPRCLVDNLFNTSIYPDHIITASEEATGFEAKHVGNCRRSRGDYWTTLTANTAGWVKVNTNGVPRAANCVIIEHLNLAGKDCNIEVSSDGFTTTDIAQSLPSIPSASSPGSPDDAYGVVTEDGVLIKSFSLRTGTDWRLYVAAGGSGYKPQVINITLGLAWVPPTPDYPWADDDQELITADIQTDAGWIGSPRIVTRRSGVLGLRLHTAIEYDVTRLNVGMYALRNPMWIMYDDQQGDRAVCGIRPPGTFGFRNDRDWISGRRAEIPWIEYEPQS